MVLISTTGDPLLFAYPKLKFKNYAPESKNQSYGKNQYSKTKTKPQKIKKRFQNQGK